MKRILMIDDDLELTDVVKFILGKEKDINVIISEDAIKGLDLANTQKPDLILMDIMMPGLNGAEAMQLMKSQTTIKDIPVIFFTGLLSQRDHNPKDLTILVDGKYYPAIPKPFETIDLLNKVKSILGIHKEK